MIRPALVVGRVEVVNWKRCSVTRSLDLHCSNFSASIASDALVDRFDNSVAAVFASTNPVNIEFDGEKVFCGYADDKLEYMLTPSGGEVVNLGGRSLAQDIKDSSIGEVDFSDDGETKPRNVSVERIASIVWAANRPAIDLNGHGGISVPFTNPAPDEPVLDYIDRMIARVGLVLTDTPEGNSIIRTIAAGSPVDKIASSRRNLMKLRYNLALRNLYRNYVAVTTADDDELEAGNDTNIRSEYESNLFAGRERRLYIPAGQVWTQETLDEYLRHSYLREAANAVQVDITVPGVRNANGNMWQIGDTLSVDHPMVQGDYYHSRREVYVGGKRLHNRLVLDAPRCL